MNSSFLSFGRKSKGSNQSYSHVDADADADNDNDNDNDNDKKMSAEERTVLTSNKERKKEGAHGSERGSKRGKMIVKTVRSAFKRATLQLETTRIRNIKKMKQSDGTIHYRVTGARTGNENGIDIIDRNIPFTHRFSKIQKYLRTLPDIFLYWSFTCKFWKFLLASIALFYGLNVLFAFFILASAWHRPECAGNINLQEMNFGLALADAFHLSWTTFSTVGYGLISPATSGHFDQTTLVNESENIVGNFMRQNKCGAVNFLLSFESLIGVLFVGFCSAIIFGKITGFQSNAKIMFSAIMPVRFGSGLMQDDDEDEDDNEDDNDGGQKKGLDESDTVTTFATAATSKEEESEDNNIKKKNTKKRLIPCPILRFRIVNQLHSHKKGEIINAELNVVATIDAKNSILGIHSKKEYNDALTPSIKQASMSASNIVKGSAAMITGTLSTVSSKVSTVSTSVKKVAKTIPLNLPRKKGSVSFSVGGKDVDLDDTNRTSRTSDDISDERTALQTRVEKLNAISQMRKSTLHLSAQEDDEEHIKVVKSTSEDSTIGARISTIQSQSSHPEDDAPLLRSTLNKNNSVYFQEETDFDKPNLVYADIPVTPNRHPFFRSVWVVSHTLDATSPLLKKKARRKVTANKGYWPEEYNSAEKVKEFIHFDKILISFRGYSSLSGSEVFHQHVYTMNDLEIGKQFQSLLMQNLDKSIYVSMKDIDALRNQDGGIGPSAQVWNSRSLSDSTYTNDDFPAREATSLLEGSKESNATTEAMAAKADKNDGKMEKIVDDGTVAAAAGANSIEQDTMELGMAEREKNGSSGDVAFFPVKLDEAHEGLDIPMDLGRKSEEVGGSSDMQEQTTQKKVIDLGLPVDNQVRKSRGKMWKK